MATEDEDLKNFVLEKVRDGESLLQQVQSQFASVDGSKKLERRIRSEIKFLQKVNLISLKKTVFKALAVQIDTFTGKLQNTGIWHCKPP